MKIVPIFNPPSNPDAGLWALKEDGCFINEYDQLVKCWTDAELMYTFAKENLEEINAYTGIDLKPKQIASGLMDEAESLDKNIRMLAIGKHQPGKLCELFKPLINREQNPYVLQPSKAASKDRRFKPPLLRIYALRIAPEAFVVTGGAIKITPLMEDADSTRQQLMRIKRVKDWLKDEGVSFPEDLKALS